MRKFLALLASAVLLAPFCFGQQAGAPAPAQKTAETAPVPVPELTKEQKKALGKAEKERKKYPDWLTVTSIEGYYVPPQAVGYVGWCGGNLSWMFCMSTPITTAGGEAKYFRARLESTGEEMALVCATGFSGRLVLLPARYPAKKGRGLNRLLGIVYVLANHNGKLKKLTCGRP